MVYISKPILATTLLVVPALTAPIGPEGRNYRTADSNLELYPRVMISSSEALALLGLGEKVLKTIEGMPTAARAIVKGGATEIKTESRAAQEVEKLVKEAKGKERAVTDEVKPLVGEPKKTNEEVEALIKQAGWSGIQTAEEAKAPVKEAGGSGIQTAEEAEALVKEEAGGSGFQTEEQVKKIIKEEGKRQAPPYVDTVGVASYAGNLGVLTGTGVNESRTHGVKPVVANATTPRKRDLEEEYYIDNDYEVHSNRGYDEEKSFSREAFGGLVPRAGLATFGGALLENGPIAVVPEVGLGEVNLRELSDSSLNDLD